jgi:hypothetical protein
MLDAILMPRGSCSDSCSRTADNFCLSSGTKRLTRYSNLNVGYLVMQLSRLSSEARPHWADRNRSVSDLRTRLPTYQARHVANSCHCLNMDV